MPTKGQSRRNVPNYAALNTPTAPLVECIELPDQDHILEEPSTATPWFPSDSGDIHRGPSAAPPWPSNHPRPEDQPLSSHPRPKDRSLSSHPRPKDRSLPSHPRPKDQPLFGTLGRQVGKGKYSIICLAERLLDGKTVCLKIMQKCLDDKDRTAKQLIAIKKEKDVYERLKKSNHRRYIMMYESILENELDVFAVMVS